MDRICISTAKGPIAHDLKLTDPEMGWILSIFALGYALFQTPGGMLADKFGARKVLSSIVAIWSAFKCNYWFGVEFHFNGDYPVFIWCS